LGAPPRRGVRAGALPLGGLAIANSPRSQGRCGHRGPTSQPLMVVLPCGVVLACLNGTTRPNAGRRNSDQNVECVFSSELNRKTVMPDLARRMDLVTTRTRGETAMRG